MYTTSYISDMFDKQINRGLMDIMSQLLPKSFTLKPEHVQSTDKLCNILVQIHHNLPKIMIDKPELKATYVLAIAQSLNNRVVVSFTPENYTNIRECICLQRLALAYCKTAFIIFRDNSIKLYFEQVNQLNYWLNVIETNLNIIHLSDKGHIHLNDYLVYQKTFDNINKRVTALIKMSPVNKYFKLQSLLLSYLKEDVKSTEVLKRSLTRTDTTELRNIHNIYNREVNKGKKIPVTIYTI